MRYPTFVARTAGVFVLLFATSVASAQANNPEQAIAERVQTYFAAMGKGELATIEQTLAPDYR